MRDLKKEEAEIRNGNRYIKEVQGSGVFARDVDRLFRKYAPLRHKVYNTHKDSFADEATRKELQSYIDEQFTKLTKEYDINGEVDFAGYIKKSLNLRVRHSFVKGRFRDNTRESLGSEDNEVEGMLASDSSSAMAIEEAELIDDLLTGASFSPVELDAFLQLVQGNAKERALSKELAERHQLPVKTCREAISAVKEYLAIKLGK